MERKIVHVVGTGTIGEPLIGLLCDYREKLGIDEVTFNKNTPLRGDRSKVIDLLKRGARLAVSEDRLDGFKELGMDPELETEEAISRASVVIDCTPSGVGHKNKEAPAHAGLVLVQQSMVSKFLRRRQPSCKAPRLRRVQLSQNLFLEV